MFSVWSRPQNRGGFFFAYREELGKTSADAATGAIPLELLQRDSTGFGSFQRTHLSCSRETIPLESWPPPPAGGTSVGEWGEMTSQDAEGEAIPLKFNLKCSMGFLGFFSGKNF